jgi:hypothetical protein
MGGSATQTVTVPFSLIEEMTDTIRGLCDAIEERLPDTRAGRDVR